MSVTIQIKRGTKAKLPTFAPGEYGLATDTKELFVGTASGNVQIAVLGSNGKIPGTNLDLSGYVPTSRTVNGKALSANITLTASDVGAAPASHTHAAGDITSGTLAVGRGGTGATTLTSGAALIGNGTGAVTTRAITNNTSASSAITGSTNLVTMNTLRYAMNRTTGINAADTNYSTAMVRGIKASTTDLTAGSSSLTNGQIYLVYE